MRKLPAYVFGVMLMAAVGALGYGVYRLIPAISPRPPAALATAPAAQDVSSQSGIDSGTSLDQPAPSTGTLTDQFGKPQRLSAFRGKVVLLTFIDSRSGGTDALTAKILGDVGSLLGSAAAKVQIVAINANPSATSVQDVRSWSEQHGMLHNWLYLTGSKSQLQAVWKSYSIYDVVAANGVVEHPPATYLIGPGGNERWLFQTSDTAAQATVVKETELVATHVAAMLPGVTLKPLTVIAGSKAPTQGKAATFTLPTLKAGGQTGSVTLGDGSPMLLEVFSTWCTDCARELPTLNSYAKDAASQHLPKVVGLNLELSEASRSVVQSWIKTKHMNYPVALDRQGTVSSYYGVSALPTQILISAKGSVLWTHEGLIGEKALMQAVRTHMAQTPA